jgi:hypothetical protein
VILQHLGDGRRQRRLAVIDVTDRAYVHVRLAAIKFFLRHKSPCIPFVACAAHSIQERRPSGSSPKTLKPAFSFQPSAFSSILHALTALLALTESAHSANAQAES